ncbi:MAG: AMP-binding protein [Thermodesulfobacteriota bacterium]
MNLFTIAAESLARLGEKDLLVFPGADAWTNARLLAEAERLAGLLLKKGVRSRDHVTLLLPNGPEVFLAFLALARLGCVSVPAGLRLTPAELAVIFRDSETGWVLTTEEFSEKVRESRTIPNQRVLDAQDLIMSRAQGDPLPQGGGSGEDLAYIVYTSGTQGEPKGVMLTHDNIVAEGRGVAEAFSVPGENPADLTQLLVLPLSHSYGLMVMSMTYFMGNKTVVLPRYRTDPVLETIQDYQVRLMWAVPTMYALMLAHPRAPEYLRSVVHWDSGGAPLPLANHKAIEERFGGTVTDGYGCTEASGCVTTQSRQQYSPPGCQGFLIEGDQMEVVDEEGNPVPDGEPGEFLISGATLMKGYWNKPECSQKVMKGSTYLSGDLGLKHPDGYYIFAERKDDLIIRGGENVFPREVENQLYQLPDVLEAAVKGAPDPVMGQEIKAYVALRPESKLDEGTLRKHLAGCLADYKIPRYIEFWKELPKNSNGKILKRNLP